MSEDENEPEPTDEILRRRFNERFSKPSEDPEALEKKQQKQLFDKKMHLLDVLESKLKDEETFVKNANEYIYALSVLASGKASYFKLECYATKMEDGFLTYERVFHFFDSNDKEVFIEDEKDDE